MGALKRASYKQLLQFSFFCEILLYQGITTFNFLLVQRKKTCLHDKIKIITFLEVFSRFEWNKYVSRKLV